jgi:Glycosyl transferase family 2
MRGLSYLLYGVLLALAGFAAFVLVAGSDVLFALFFGRWPEHLSHDAYLASGIAVWAGIVLASIDIFLFLPEKRRNLLVPFDPPDATALTVVLTAYDDQESIGQAVADFRSHALVRRVIVVDNNSSDGTSEAASRNGAIVVRETRPGYGHCVFRALTEGAGCEDTKLTLLCEGDMTFRAYDIDKFMAYIPHADIVNGTRIVEQLRAVKTQLTTFMYYGNFFVAKLLEAKHIGRGTFTDVGTTYKLCRNESLRALLPRLNPDINLEFNAHFLDTALAQGFRLVECPVTFHNRVGVSKGGNTSNLRALAVGLRMMRGIVFSWSFR